MLNIPSLIKEKLTQYDKEKGGGRMLFGDQADIKKLRELNNKIENKDKLDSNEWLELFKILKDRETSKGLANQLLSEIEAILFKDDIVREIRVYQLSPSLNENLNERLRSVANILGIISDAGILTQENLHQVTSGLDAFPVLNAALFIINYLSLMNLLTEDHLNTILVGLTIQTSARSYYLKEIFEYISPERGLKTQKNVSNVMAIYKKWKDLPDLSILNVFSHVPIDNEVLTAENLRILLELHKTEKPDEAGFKTFYDKLFKLTLAFFRAQRILMMSPIIRDTLISHEHPEKLAQMFQMLSIADLINKPSYVRAAAMLPNSVFESTEFKDAMSKLSPIREATDEEKVNLKSFIDKLLEPYKNKPEGFFDKRKSHEEPPQLPGKGPQKH